MFQIRKKWGAPQLLVLTRSSGEGVMSVCKVHCSMGDLGRPPQCYSRNDSGCISAPPPNYCRGPDPCPGGAEECMRGAPNVWAQYCANYEISQS